MIGFKSHILIFTCFLVLSLWANAQQSKTAIIPMTSVADQAPVLKTRVLFIFDASGSMEREWDRSSRISIAKSIMTRLMDSLQKVPNLELALRTFGSYSPLAANDCKDTRLEVPFKTNNAAAIKAKLSTITTRGITPIAYSIQLAANDFTPSITPVRNIMILITDGVESCDGYPCLVSLNLQKKGVILTPFVIGIGLTPKEIDFFECMGKVYDAANTSTFQKVTKSIMSQILDNTTCEVDLLDQNGKATETNVGITFYDAMSGLIRYNYIHTFNNRGVPDTLRIDPVNRYNIVVNTTPPVELKNVEMKPRKHNVFSISTPQGDLALAIDGLAPNLPIPCLVSLSNSDSTISHQDFGTSKRYLTGRYDLEVLTLPRINIKNIEISQSKTTTIKIPSPGLVTILNTNAVPVFGSLYELQGKEMKWLVDITGNLSTETMSLQPGNYSLIYRIRSAKKAMSTREIKFRVAPGSSVPIKL